MRTQSLLTAALLLAVIWCEIVRGKFVKMEDLHLKEEVVGEKTKNNWINDSFQLPGSNRTTMLRGYRYNNGGGGAASGSMMGGESKLLQSVNELNLDGDLSVDESSKKEWKTFYYPHQYGHTTGGTSSSTGTVLANVAAAGGGVPFGWSNGVITNNNLLTVGGYNPALVTAAAPFDFGGYKPATTSSSLGSGVGSTLHCLLFGVMGLVTFLLNTVMALLLSVKLPALDGLLGPLLGGGLGLLGALTKHDSVAAADTKSKNVEYVHFPAAAGVVAANEERNEVQNQSRDHF